MLFLTKIRRATREVVFTSIAPNQISGMEPAKIKLANGKIVEGTKVFINGDYFYAMSSPMLLAHARSFSLKSGDNLLLTGNSIAKLDTLQSLNQLPVLGSKVKGPILIPSGASLLT